MSSEQNKIEYIEIEGAKYYKEAKHRRELRWRAAHTATLPVPDGYVEGSEVVICTTGPARGLCVGSYYKGLFTIHADGKTTFSEKAFVDDMAAVNCLLASRNPTIDREIIDDLVDFVDKMDARAVKRHAYDRNAEEASFNYVPRVQAA